MQVTAAVTIILCPLVFTKVSIIRFLISLGEFTEPLSAGSLFLYYCGSLYPLDQRPVKEYYITSSPHFRVYPICSLYSPVNIKLS